MWRTEQPKQGLPKLRREDGSALCVKQLVGVAIGAAYRSWTCCFRIPPQARAPALPLPGGQIIVGSGLQAMVREAVMADGTLDQELECLALNVYFEARGEPMTGKYAVAAVTLNRVVKPQFLPAAYARWCARAPASAGSACQFSWVCDRYSTGRATPTPWELAKQVAYNALVLDRPDPDRRRPIISRLLGRALLGRGRWSRLAASAVTSSTVSAARGAPRWPKWSIPIIDLT